MGKKEEIDFSKMFQNKRLPILTLDKRWHDLFPEYEKTSEIKKLETNLNNLIKKQGQLNNDIIEMKKLKKILMDEIVNNMDGALDTKNTLKSRKLNKSQKLIKDINEKVIKNDLELDNIPDVIKRANEKLVVESMNVCYEKLYANTEEIKEISEWVDKARMELRDKILKKKDLEEYNTYVYTYIHNLLGPEVLQILDDKIGKYQDFQIGEEK